MKKLATLTLTLLIFGCATTENFDTYHNSTIGRPVQWVMEVWGYPQSSFVGPSGNKVYVFSRSKQGSYTTPQSTYIDVIGNTATATTYGGNTRNYTNSCTVWVEVDSAEVVRSWRRQGNACKLHDSWVK